MKTAVLTFAVVATVSLGACRERDVDAARAEQVASTQAQGATPARPENVHPRVVVYKSASCGCCGKWVEHMQSHGFPVEVHNVDNLGPHKERVGLPAGMGSCHTAEVDGYFIEGHVPAAEVLRLIAEKPQAKGLAVPGMPIGSPGMEQGEQVDNYQVLLVNQDGSTSVYASYPK